MVLSFLIATLRATEDTLSVQYFSQSCSYIGVLFKIKVLHPNSKFSNLDNEILVFFSKFEKRLKPSISVRMYHDESCKEKKDTAVSKDLISILYLCRITHMLDIGVGFSLDIFQKFQIQFQLNPTDNIFCRIVTPIYTIAK